MGNYTRHSLRILEGDSHVDDHKVGISEQSGYSYCFEDRIKWYEMEFDMKDYSKQHPNTVFEISGGGEESGDLWKAYFKNGKMQMCKAKITYDEYDETKLQ